MENVILEKLNAEDQAFEDLRPLYMKSFPDYERKPFEMIEEGLENGKMEAFRLRSAEKENTKSIGLAFTILGDRVMVLDYLAVDPDQQSSGYGARILESLERQYEKPIVVEIESTFASEEEDRKRRKNFYLRNGFFDDKTRILLFGTEMELMSTDRPVSFDEYFETMSDYFKDRFPEDLSHYISRVSFE